MAEYTNTNQHAIYVRDPNATSLDGTTRVESGQTINASGPFEDNLKATEGVYPANSDEAKSFQAAPEPVDDRTTDQARARLQGVARENQVAVADPTAPGGPNEGGPVLVRDVPTTDTNVARKGEFGHAGDPAAEPTVGEPVESEPDRTPSGPGAPDVVHGAPAQDVPIPEDAVEQATPKSGRRGGSRKKGDS